MKAQNRHQRGAPCPVNNHLTNAPCRFRTLWRVAACIGLLVASHGRAAAATHVCGLVYGTWTAANSPYILDCNVQAANLTIQPGVTVSASNYTFEVDGVLTAIGTAAQPIVFNALNPAVGWQGIWFNLSNPGSEMSYCIISNAVNSGVRILNSLPYFDHCTIANNRAPSSGGGILASVSPNTLVLNCCVVIGNTANPSCSSSLGFGGGVCVNAGGLQMSGCSVLNNEAIGCAPNTGANNNGYGGGVYAAGPVQVNNCIFSGNTAYGQASFGGAYAYGGGMMASGTGPLSAVNCVFSSNTSLGSSARYGSGLFIDSGVASPSVVNCTFAYNNVEGLNSSAPRATVMNSILFFNEAGGTQIIGTTNVTYCDVQNGLPGQGNLNANPIFCSQTNLVTAPGSLCIDAGNPATAYNDACFNGNSGGCTFALGTARNDMGAYGGPGACCWACGACTAPVITSQPQPETACVGGQASFSVGATGSQPLTYQWRFHGTNFTGAPVDIGGATNDVYTMSNVQSNQAGYYSVLVANSLGSVVSATNLLMLEPICVTVDIYAGLYMSGGVPGQSYRILSATNLTPPVAWQTNWSFIQNAGGTLWIDTNSPANKPEKFYLVTP